MSLYSLIRPLLFSMDAEKAHDVSLRSLRAVHGTPLHSLLSVNVPDDPVEFWGLPFRHRVGLAAGLDKNADYLDALGALGFAFIEVGTVTPRPQPGNAKPRIFRLKQAEAIINRMGFNNKGVDHLVEQVKQSHYDGIIGINIGKNFDTPVEKANDDYLIGLRKVYAHADYVTVNISSPNTQGLRSLQYGEALDSLLATLKAEQRTLAASHQKNVPLLLKIAPDLSQDEVVQIADALVRNQIDGVIATNTTLSRVGVEQLPHGNETGGLSGKPVQQKSTEVLRWLKAELKGQMPIIGVGGIHDAQSAAEKRAAGADLLQIYTGFIYQGASLIRTAAIAAR
ncbi:quinone-dependent dihydroorotate dehydrogenase [Permianibacter aggregans]|uniref:Dihydroorotate dehydrogenase (quinone) n=1 Tax=Permianibacter aggregans TaxID=1510150 RepID=A0A4R6UGX7_9GAMM|nr:quinone-dependent dihydroorotate dehydrogenase [Permianibacter aggregans]QGX41160.1 quinone-dependent dihydroorotate dehydrogenase [Permianibacter aggregans]TDQ44529.1 dihydroorotate oxidase A [Permianibacter aggregans]